MLIIMKTLYASPERSIQPGETVDLPSDEAKRLVDGRFAYAVEDDPAEKLRKSQSSGRRGARAGKPNRG